MTGLSAWALGPPDVDAAQAAAAANGDALLLSYVPGCALGSAWSGADLEGDVLWSVWLASLVQTAALLLFLGDQACSLVQACLFRCNTHGGAFSWQRHSARRGAFGAGGGTEASAPGAGGVASEAAVESFQQQQQLPAGAAQAHDRRGFDSTRVWVPEAWVAPASVRDERVCFVCSRRRGRHHARLRLGSGLDGGAALEQQQQIALRQDERLPEAAVNEVVQRRGAVVLVGFGCCSIVCC